MSFFAEEAESGRDRLAVQVKHGDLQPLLYQFAVFPSRGHIYYAQQLSRCGHEIGFALTSEPRDTGVDPLDPEVIAVVRDWLAGAEPSAAPRPEVRTRGRSDARPISRILGWRLALGGSVG